MSPYPKLHSIIGLAAFWLCFGSLWAERASQALKLPLNPFEKWPIGDATKRAEDITLIAIFVCWPFMLATLHLLRRVAEHSGAKSRWESLPAPFDLHLGLKPWEDKCYRLFFMLLFWLIPTIHVLHFANRFFFRSPPVPMFHWTFASWFSGIEGKGRLYGGLSYFGWTPILVIGGLVGVIVLNLLWARALFHRSAHPAVR